MTTTALTVPVSSQSQPTEATAAREPRTKQQQQLSSEKTQTQTATPTPSVVVGVKGVRLKHFERALAKLLPHVEPRYLPLRCLPPSDLLSKPWNTSLPPAARVHGKLPGQISDPIKAGRKEGQIKSLLRCIGALLSSRDTRRRKEAPITIVDFGGGSGHLSIPLALLLPHCRIVCLDLKQKSLDLLHEKARHCSIDNPGVQQETTIIESEENIFATKNDHQWNQTAIPNLWTFSGDIESFTDSFHMGVALHVCGEGTDVVIRKCTQNKAHMVVAPCCVGKLNRQAKDPYIYRATAQNTHTIQYPQSNLFRQCLECSSSREKDKNDQQHIHRLLADDWDALAKAADYNHELDMNDCRNAARRTAKGTLEMDRLLYLREQYPKQYQTVLTRMEPLAASPKHDILLGYCCGDDMIDASSSTLLFSSDKLQEDRVVHWTKDHLLNPSSNSQPEQPSVSKENACENIASKQLTAADQMKQPSADSVDWSWQEEQEIRQQISTYFDLSAEEIVMIDDAAINKNKEDGKPFTSPSEIAEKPTSSSDSDITAMKSSTLIFPAGMGKRKRKLIHYVAEDLGLAHWCVGKKHAEKTVAVRRKYACTSTKEHTNNCTNNSNT